MDSVPNSRFQSEQWVQLLTVSRIERGSPPQDETGFSRSWRIRRSGVALPSSGILHTCISSIPRFLHTCISSIPRFLHTCVFLPRRSGFTRARGDSVEIPTGFYALRRSRRPVLPLAAKKSSQINGQIANRGVVFPAIYISKGVPEIRHSRRVPLSIEGMDPQGFGSFLDAL